MGLREQAAADFADFAEDLDGFGMPITVTDPSGASAAITGLSNDIHQVIDPNTGQLVSSRAASVSFRIAALTEAGLGLPEGVADTSRKPWVVRFDDLAGGEHVFKVREAMPDRTIGSVTCTLEIYQP